MGCDGGTIPKRCELVNEKKKKEKKDKNADLKARWNNCAISQLQLVKPIVCCELGRWELDRVEPRTYFVDTLYNKESVIEFLLNKSQADHSTSFNHLRGLKDIKELNLTDNLAFVDRGAEKVDSSEMQRAATSPFVCPIVGVEMSGKYRFIVLWSCGCVFSERALKEVKGDQCHKCGKPFKGDDIVIINGTPEDVEQLKKRMDERRAKAKLEKKPPRKALPAAAGSEAAVSTEAPLSNGLHAGEKRALPIAAASTEVAGLIDKLEPQAVCIEAIDGPNRKKSKLAYSAAAAAGTQPTAGKLLQPSSATSSSTKLTSKCKSLQADSSRSDTFKSLFTTHQTALSQPKPHWVTFNPQYF